MLKIVTLTKIEIEKLLLLSQLPSKYLIKDIDVVSMRVDSDSTTFYSRSGPITSNFSKSEVTAFDQTTVFNVSATGLRDALKLVKSQMSSQKLTHVILWKAKNDLRFTCLGEKPIYSVGYITESFGEDAENNSFVRQYEELLQRSPGYQFRIELETFSRLAKDSTFASNGTEYVENSFSHVLYNRSRLTYDAQTYKLKIDSSYKEKMFERVYEDVLLAGRPYKAYEQTDHLIGGMLIETDALSFFDLYRKTIKDKSDVSVIFSEDCWLISDCFPKDGASFVVTCREPDSADKKRCFELIDSVRKYFSVEEKDKDAAKTFVFDANELKSMLVSLKPYFSNKKDRESRFLVFEPADWSNGIGKFNVHVDQKHCDESLRKTELTFSTESDTMRVFGMNYSYLCDVVELFSTSFNIQFTLDGNRIICDGFEPGSKAVVMEYVVAKSYNM